MSRFCTCCIFLFEMMSRSDLFQQIKDRGVIRGWGGDALVQVPSLETDILKQQTFSARGPSLYIYNLTSVDVRLWTSDSEV